VLIIHKLQRIVLNHKKDKIHQQMNQMLEVQNNFHQIENLFKLQ